jgi:opacity protein-like surface antigen
MKRTLTAIVLSSLLAVGASAQTIYDGAKIIGRDLNGTARFVGMGGAMGALGGDITTISTNPAGIGIYRSNEAMLSLSFSSIGADSKYDGQTFEKNRSRLNFDNIGVVLSNQIGNETTLRYVNFGFNYKRSNTLNRNMEMGGTFGPSQTYQMASLTDGLPENGLQGSMWDLWNDSEIGWLSTLGYNGYLINPKTPGGDEYEGMYDNPYASFLSKERGGVSQYDFNISLNLSDRVYLGMTVGAYDVNYRKSTVYSEGWSNGENYTLESDNMITGEGYDVKLGAIFRPFESSPFRLGLALHTPTYYRLTHATSAYLVAETLDAGELYRETVDSFYDLSGDMKTEYRLNSPWKYNASLGYTVGSSLALGAEYEYQDYSSMRFKYDDGSGDSMEYENSTARDFMKGVHTLRLGAEYNVIPQFAIRAGYNFSTAAFDQDQAYKDLPYYSVITDTDFSNSRSLSNYTLGIGYRGQSYYLDLTYQLSQSKDDFFAFAYEENGVAYTPAPTKVTNSKSQVLLTFGLRF